MAEEGIGRLKFQFPGTGILLGAYVKHCTELRIAMGMGLNRSSIAAVHQGPYFLDVDVEAIGWPQ